MPRNAHKIILLFTSILFAWACGRPESKKCTYIDLSWPFDNDTVYWPGLPSFTFPEVLDTYAQDGFSMFTYSAAEHGGTHIDAPVHFNPGAWTVAEIPFERLISTAALVDLSDEVAASGDPNFYVTPEHLENWEKVNGPFENGSVLLIKFGWSKYWPNKTNYLGLKSIPKETAEWIVNQNKFYGVGVDTASVDAGNANPLVAHQILLKGYLYNMEMINMNEELPGTLRKKYSNHYQKNINVQ
ncbi:unnamed protein product [Brassicogethes aeneus]|uniref:Cyclase family protein n=1 Tax=Brassicogethes aeneus TaxID=1431903 RepID=A0A9P0BJ25_BRAAE|nr:unnamed protein product [Brassicogethes aeneus]